MEKLKDGVQYEMIPHSAMFDSRLSDKAFRLLCILRAETVSTRGECYRSYEELKTLTGISSFTTVKNAVDELVEAGWVKVVVKGGIASNGLKRRNAYQVCINNEPGEEVLRKKSKKQDTPKEEVAKPDTPVATKSDTPKQGSGSTPKTESHKTIKPSGKKYTDDRKVYFLTIKRKALSLAISSLWRQQILEWVTQVLDEDAEGVMSTYTPEQLWEKGVRKFRDSDLRWVNED